MSLYEAYLYQEDLPFINHPSFILPQSWTNVHFSLHNLAKMEPELSTSPCLPHVEMFLLPLLNAALFFTVHSSVFLHYTFIVLLGTEKQNLSLRKNETYAALYHLLGAEGAPVCPCSWNFSKLPVEKRTLFPLKILRASSIRLLSEPKHICFHKRIVGCLLTAKCLF